MKFLNTILILALSSSLLVAAEKVKLTKEQKQLQETIKHGDNSSKMLLETLDTDIKKHMVQGGLSKTFDFCSNEAYNVTQKVNKKIPKGVKIKRISSKYRSPANAPKSGETAVLESFEAMIDAGVVLPEYLVQKVDANTDKYYKALVIKDQVCLQCHGEISKDVDFRRKIAAIYPLDNAVGYKMGDLRGAVVVTVKHQ